MSNTLPLSMKRRARPLRMVPRTIDRLLRRRQQHHRQHDAFARHMPNWQIQTLIAMHNADSNTGTMSHAPKCRIGKSTQWARTRRRLGCNKPRRHSCGSSMPINTLDRTIHDRTDCCCFFSLIKCCLLFYLVLLLLFLSPFATHPTFVNVYR